MALPVITSVTVTYPSGSSLAPGETAIIDVEAVDGDNYTVVVSLFVTDSSGNESNGTATVLVGDSLTYSAGADVGTVVADPIVAGRFYFTAP